MKIACVAPAYPYRGGIAHFGVSLARELQKNHQCLYINFKRLYPDIFFPGKTQFDTSDESFSFPTEELIDSISPFSWYQTGRRIRKWGADVVIFHWWHSFFGPAYRGIICALGNNSKQIAICHNVVPHDHGLVKRSAVAFGLKRMDGLVIHSHSEEGELQKLLPKHPSLTLFHPLYDIFPDHTISKNDARDQLDLNTEDKVILYFGLIRPYKGVKVLLQSLQRLSSIERLKVMIVGEIYSEKDSIIRLIKTLPLGMVRLVDQYIPNEEVATWFRAADIVALPYLSATQSGVVPIAYLCERPVIVTRVGGLPDIVLDGESGYLIEPNDAVALANIISKHFIERENPTLLAGIKQVSNRLSWNSYSQLISQFANNIEIK